MDKLKLWILVKVPILAALLASTSAGAADIPGYPDSVTQYDPREVALLPTYCKFTQLFRDELHADPAEVARWYDVMGPPFHAMHHYCWGLMKTNRALLLARTQQVRTYNLASSLDEFNYVIKNSPPDFVMLPEIHTKKGENLLRLGRTALGIAELERAIQLKPDYWPPYAAISDHYKKKGDEAKAREWLEKALAFAPDAKGLQTRMAELQGGKPKPDR
jgi:tetratricopeptide (TPR) repeat protein